MNALLAEAKAPGNIVPEIEEINESFSKADVAVVTSSSDMASLTAQFAIVEQPRSF